MTTKERLVTTATTLFAEKGFTATGMSEILDKAKVHRGSLYHAFPAKKDLLVAVLEGYRDGIESRLLDPAWQGIHDPIERVFALLHRYRTFLEETDYLFGCPIGSLALELRDTDPEVRQLLVANFDQWISHVQKCFEGARNRLPRGTDTRALAVFSLTTMEGAVMLSRTYRNLEAFDSAVSSLRKYIDCLLSNKRSRHSPKS